jgi:hypothetical protein
LTQRSDREANEVVDRWGGFLELGLLGWRRMQGVFLLIFGIGAPLALATVGFLSWAWLGLGAAAWAAALFVKAVPGGLVWLASRRWVESKRKRAAVWGTWSALCELGASAVVFLSATPYPELREALAFGIGAAVIEIAYVIVVAIVPGKTEENAGEEDRFVAWSGVMERGSTLVGHVATRGLVWAGFRHWSLFPAILLAIATFSLVDAVASYGSDEKWPWTEPRFCRRFQGFLAYVAALELLAFLVLLVIVHRTA